MKGHIGQDPLSAMIKVDESGLARSRYRRYIYYSALSPNRLCGYPEGTILHYSCLPARKRILTHVQTPHLLPHGSA
jgi:hypothetical protein